jgi:hypothetical protein
MSVFINHTFYMSYLSSQYGIGVLQYSCYIYKYIYICLHNSESGPFSSTSFCATLYGLKLCLWLSFLEGIDFILIYIIGR